MFDCTFMSLWKHKWHRDCGDEFQNAPIPIMELLVYGNKSYNSQTIKRMPVSLGLLPHIDDVRKDQPVCKCAKSVSMRDSCLEL